MIGMEQGRGGDVALRSVGWGAGLPQLWSCLLPSPASIKKKKKVKKKLKQSFILKDSDSRKQMLLSLWSLEK